MGSAAVAADTAVQDSFAELERQQDLISSCTNLWKELSNHFTSLERRLEDRSAALRRRNQTLDLTVRRTLDFLHRREDSIDSSVDLALSRLNSLPAPPHAEDSTLPARLSSLCLNMDATSFFDLVLSKRKEMDALRSAVPVALGHCVDPPKFAMDAISNVFPVDQRAVKTPIDLGWACVLILESLVPAVEDPELGVARPLVPRAAKDRAREMADVWKKGVEERGGVEELRPADVHAFLQHLVTFGVVAKEDRELYRKLVLSIAWRRQMPKLAVALGLEDMMMDMIEELISKGQQLDAISFAYEAGLEDKFPPVPLLKSFLEDAKKATTSNLEDHNNSGLTMFNASRKEQSAIRAAMKCIEERKLETEFPLEDLQKRLEHLEKAKVEKKKSPSPAGPANKRTRVNCGGPMPPAKAGRLTHNAYVSSFPAPNATATFVRSPSSHPSYLSPTSHPSYPSPTSHPSYPSAAAPLYPYDRTAGHGVYGSRSPPALRDPYAAYSPEVVPSAVLGSPYSPAPMHYPPYGGYTNGGYNNVLSPGYQTAYYR